MNLATATHTPRHPILVVDDDPDIRDSLKDLLELEGYVVRTAEHGRAGLEQLQQMPQRPCMILLDLMMPVMDGRQFLDAVQRGGNPALATIPVTVVSALDQARDLQRAYRCEVMRKPIDMGRLLDAAQRHCADC